LISLTDIREAHKRISGVAARTPLIRCPQAPLAQPLYFKPESLQPIGAFKLRGAYNKIASLTPEQRQRGVIAFSSGNHAQGVAYAARHLGIPATVLMPASAPEVKKAGTKALGAEIIFLDGSEEDWRRAAEEMAVERNLTMVTPFDDEAIVAGQGTVGLEILEDLPEVGTILVPVGGGGLLSGVAAAIKLSGSPARVIGVEPEVADDARRSFRSGQIVELPREQAGKTIADGMRATHVGEITFAHIREFVDDIITVSETEIRSAMRRIILEARLLAEPSGAVSFAAFLFHENELSLSGSTVAIVSGGNVEPALLVEILS
jgi:threonine dehydratase